MSINMPALMSSVCTTSIVVGVLVVALYVWQEWRR